jgi:hypothetical protein
VARTYEPLLLVPAYLVLLAWVVMDAYSPNADAWFHIGCAGLYLEHGWVASFPWLPYTILGDSFPNAYLLLHLILVPFRAIFEMETAVRIATFSLNAALLTSVYIVLLRWKVAFASAWVTLLALSSTLSITLGAQLRGGILFYILLVWIIDALWRGRHRTAFVLTWLSVYAYVGAPVLLALTLVLFAVRGLWDRAWDGRPLAAVAGGLAAGYVANPFWPDQWAYLWGEVTSTFVHPPELEPGVFFGVNWTRLPSDLIVEFSFSFLFLWVVLLVRQGYLGRRVDSRAAAGAVACIGVFGAACVSGVHLLHLFFVSSFLFIPLLASRLGPWSRYAVVHALAAGILVCGWAVRTAWVDVTTSDRPVTTDEWREAAAVLEENTEPGEVVIAPWDAFPGLFAASRHNSYVAGMNMNFLRQKSPKQFNAYVNLLRGRVIDPESLLPMFFDDARTLILPSRPRNAGERKLVEKLEANPHFGEIEGTASFRIFRLQR